MTICIFMFSDEHKTPLFTGITKYFCSKVPVDISLYYISRGMTINTNQCGILTRIMLQRIFFATGN